MRKIVILAGLVATPLLLTGCNITNTANTTGNVVVTPDANTVDATNMTSNMADNMSVPSNTAGNARDSMRGKGERQDGVGVDRQDGVGVDRQDGVGVDRQDNKKLDK
jgi:hypothetical protein